MPRRSPFGSANDFGTQNDVAFEPRPPGDRRGRQLPVELPRYPAEDRRRTAPMYLRGCALRHRKLQRQRPTLLAKGKTILRETDLAPLTAMEKELDIVFSHHPQAVLDHHPAFNLVQNNAPLVHHRIGQPHESVLPTLEQILFL